MNADAALFTAKGDTFYLIWAAVLVFFMQCGFAMVEAGTVRAKNTKNILIKNLLDACIGALIWFATGMGIAFGDSTDSPYFGTGVGNYALHSRDWSASYTSEGYDWATWFFQFTFAATAATIVSGGVAERCALSAYLAYSVALTGFVYPVVVHLVWDSEGLLSAFNSGSPVLGGVIDFAGSGVVHMTGGIAAFVGAIFLGPRIGRFSAEGKPMPMPGHSSVLQSLGVFILWLGWYGFNGGSTLAVFSSAYSRDLARVCVTTTLGAASAALTSVMIAHQFTHVWDVSAVGNGILAGLVSITANCVVIEPWAAIVIGMFGGAIYQGASKLVLKMKVDDPLDAFAVHGVCGAWGLVASGVFCRPEYSYNGLGSHGFVYPGAQPDLLGIQIVTFLIITIWVGVCSTVIFGSLRLAGILRVPAEVEEAGMDVSKHGGEAYDLSVPPAKA
ncbi:hypothetical protein KFE25_014313 [Diacronema lutheri]|uniref:Ammonium transporter n=1 Tax=Diacronema lutheri TaxID=2081491 RepID=A0A8J5XAZ8_DIALT|nr:hypothetical protein KFE25_014313 [Diacronema lutheri]